MKLLFLSITIFAACGVADAAAPTTQPVAIRADKIYTMSGDTIDNGVIICRNGKIEAISRAADVQIPNDIKILQAKVATPGLIDAHTVLGLQGYRNEPREQDQLEIQWYLMAVAALRPSVGRHERRGEIALTEGAAEVDVVAAPRAQQNRQKAPQQSRQGRPPARRSRTASSARRGSGAGSATGSGATGRPHSAASFSSNRRGR